MTMRSPAFALLAAAALAAGGAALAQEGAPKEEKPAGTVYWFGASEVRTTILFESETSVETIHGVCRKMTGSATFDFETGTGSAGLTVPVASLQTGLDKRDEHLRSDDWLDAAKFPEIAFKAKALKRVKSDEATKRETWAFEGTITIHGVTRDLKGEASVQRIPEDLGKKLGPGSWVKVKTAFQVALKDFDIKVPDIAAAKVSPVWDLKVDIFGTTQALKRE